MLIRCTTKLLKEMGLRSKDLSDEPESRSSSLLGQWHANLLYINRRKTLLFVNDRTLFNFVVPDLARSQIRELPDQFRLMLSAVLADEGVPEPIRERVLGEYEEIGLAKSSDRSVLGSSNDIAFHYKYRIEEEGGVHSWRVPGIIRELNRMPLQAIRYGFPIDELGRLCGFGPSHRTPGTKRRDDLLR